MRSTPQSGSHVYYPEMGETRPATQIDARLGHDGHYYLTSQIVLSGRGVTHLGTLTANQLMPQAQHKAGWLKYRVTRRAFAAICKQHAVASESLLS